MYRKYLYRYPDDNIYRYLYRYRYLAPVCVRVIHEQPACRVRGGACVWCGMLVCATLLPVPVCCVVCTLYP